MILKGDVSSSAHPFNISRLDSINIHAYASSDSLCSSVIAGKPFNSVTHTNLSNAFEASTFLHVFCLQSSKSYDLTRSESRHKNLQADIIYSSCDSTSLRYQSFTGVRQNKERGIDCTSSFLFIAFESHVQRGGWMTRHCEGMHVGPPKTIIGENSESVTF